jgi:hypothetical protein
MKNMRSFSIAASAAVLIVVSGGIAFSGEVKGPPGTIDNTNTTAAPTHANSIAAFSGLNDYDSQEGQNDNLTQTPADSSKIYGGSPGCSGGGCKGGSNPDRIPPN